MTVTYEVFKKQCKKIFQFLEDEFGFQIVASEQDLYGMDITYQNSTTAIEIRFEPRENRIFILLMRLIKGELPNYPIFIKNESEVNSFYLDDLIDLKTPSSKVKQKKFGDWLTSQDLENILIKYATVLKQYGTDILRGDFKVFSKLEKIVKVRTEVIKKQKNEE